MPRSAAIPLHRAGLIQWSERYNLVTQSDAAGMALFVITSANVAFVAGASPISAAFVGALLYVGLVEADLDPQAVFWIPIGVIFGIRVLSIARGWGVPVVELDRQKSDRSPVDGD